MSKIVDIEYKYKKDNKYINAMYIYIAFLIFLLLLCLILLYKN